MVAGGVNKISNKHEEVGRNSIKFETLDAMQVRRTKQGRTKGAHQRRKADGGIG